MVLKIVVISAVLSCFGMFAHASEYSVCKEPLTGSIISLTIKECEDKPKPCELKIGTNATLNIIFASTADSLTLTAAALAKFPSSGMRLTIPNDDGCKSSGILCPVRSGRTYSYTTTVPIKDYYPKSTVEILWYLLGSQGQAFVCVKIPATVVA